MTSIEPGRAKAFSGSFYNHDQIRTHRQKNMRKTRDMEKDHAKLVVAIDGYAGSGKTTVSNFIAKHDTNVLSIHLDDFIKHRKVRKK